MLEFYYKEKKSTPYLFLFYLTILIIINYRTTNMNKSVQFIEYIYTEKFYLNL